MESIMIETSNILAPTSWALLHSLWQGVVIYLLLKAVLAIVPTNYAVLRYNASVFAMTVLLLSFGGTFWYYYQSTSVATTTYSLHNIPISTVEQQTILSPAINWWQDLNSWYVHNTKLIVNIYLVGIMLFISRIVFNLIRIKSLKTAGTSEPTEQWIILLKKSLQNLNITKHVQLFFSSKVTVPVIVGTVKPVILIPIALANQLTVAQIESILVHELAHIKRNDYLINVLQMFIETVLFFNPFVWYISRQIRETREYCCDDIVVNNANKLSYIKALATLETYRQQSLQPVLAAKGSQQHLLTRIKRIMEMKNDNINYSQLIAVVLTFVVLATSITIVSPNTYAQTKKKKKDTGVSTQTKKIIIKTNDDTDDALTKTYVIDIKKDGSTTETRGDNNGKVVKVVTIDDDDVDIDMLIDSISHSTVSKINWKDIEKEVETAIGDKDWEEVRDEIKKAMDEVKIAMTEVIKIEGGENKKMTVVKNTGSSTNRNNNIVIDYSGTGTPQHDYTSMLEQMKKDGLINTNKGYKIKKDKNTLYIDGVKQSKTVYDKYEQMLNAKELLIEGNKDDLSIMIFD